MTIDISTFYLAGALVSALAAAVVFAGGGLQSRHNGLSQIVFATLSLVPGLAAISLSGAYGMAWLQGLGESFVGLSALLVRFAVDRLHGLRERSRVPLFVFGAVLLATWAAIIGGVAEHIQSAVGAFGMAVMFLLPLPVLVAAPAPHSGRAHQIALFAFGLATAAALSRGYVVAMDAAPVYLTVQTAVNAMFALAVLGAMAAGAFAFLVMLRQRELATLSMLDGLTEILNRRALHDQIEQVLSLALRRGLACSVLLADLDHFSRINVEQGHRAGDDVLQHFVALARTVVRREDVLGRYGGEQFAMLLFATPASGAQALARRLRTALASKPPRIKGLGIIVTASFGVAESKPGDELAATELLRRADAALVEAKARGRDCVVGYEDLAADRGAAAH